MSTDELHMSHACPLVAPDFRCTLFFFLWKMQRKRKRERKKIEMEYGMNNKREKKLKNAARTFHFYFIKVNNLINRALCARPLTHSLTHALTIYIFTSVYSSFAVCTLNSTLTEKVRFTIFCSVSPVAATEPADLLTCICMRVRMGSHLCIYTITDWLWCIWLIYSFLFESEEEENRCK